MLDLEYRESAILVRIRAMPRQVLTAELLDGLTAAIAYIGPDRPIILTGAGSVFAPDLDPAPGPIRAAASNRLSRVLNRIRSHRLPVVAAINGDAIGAGYKLAEAADIRIMSGGVIQPFSRSGMRYRAPAAVAAGLVEHRCEPAELVSLAMREVGVQRTRIAVPG
ncbi:MAG TPA: enoyl-CoA hydratase/isomerase family protein [Amycolatopsis sp.]|uniref:enoyl-CoA hydratase/isomerase family protein n=1 Tax=Amycolatopsis sp. TaxID=37632 RepID=UPI002B48D4FE|nr:enoyl-CoA hydratase/isomerase family protein [Amycolatopsis sp.]HKS47533.1 enoyl-CoA hydratase/isomerase family protein [Amycolatopsis sp.]